MLKAITFVAGATALLLQSGTAQACRCVPPDDTNQAYSSADLVVYGKVTDIEGNLSTPQGQTVGFQARTTWKSSARPSFRFVNRTTCAMDLKVGESYLLFLHELPEGGGFGADKCSGSLSGARADEAAKLLKDAKPESR